MLVRLILPFILFFCLNFDCNASSRYVKMVDMTESKYIRAELSNGDMRDYNGSRRSSNLVLMNSKIGGYLVYDLNKKYEKFYVDVYLSQKFRPPTGKGIKVIVLCDGDVKHVVENLTFKKKEKIAIELTNINKMEIFVFDVSNYSNRLISFKSEDLASYSKATYQKVLNNSADVFFYRGEFRKHNHSLTGMKEIKKADCTMSGLQENKCKICGEVIDSKVVQPLGHKNNEKWVRVKDATCSTLGVETLSCTVCNQVINKRELPLAPHLYDKKGEFIIKAPTCSEPGIIGRKCFVCGNVDEETIPKSEHVVKGWKVVSGSVLNNPIVKEGKCSVCKETIRVDDNRYIVIEWIVKLIPLVILLIVLSYYFYFKPKGYYFNIRF